MSKPSNKNQTLRAANPSKVLPKTINPFSSHMMKQLTALMTFGVLFGSPRMFKPKVLVKKKCLNCEATHTHSNAYCCTYCCHSWRLENPHKGKANHYFGEFNLACKTVDGVEQVIG